jgi:hypothetical protein
MTYIRLTGGRDRGHVKDMPHVDAQRMLGNGEALPVDFNEPDPLGFREISAPIAEQDQDKELPALAADSTPPTQNRPKSAKKGSR